MKRLAIITSFIRTGDAVSNDVVGMYRVLEAYGYDVRIYTDGGRYEELKIWPVFEIQHFLRDPEDILIYHYSIGWEPGLNLLREHEFKTVVKYHNITPPEFFIGISEWHEKMCRAGREQLLDVAAAESDLYLADSAYNLDELISVGVSDSDSYVIPPFHHTDRLHRIEPDLAVLDKYRDGKTNILTVGRVAPHKGHLQLIEAFAAYHHDYNSSSRLIIVGSEEEAFKIYSAQIRQLVAALWLEGAVEITGEVTDRELKSYYLVADVYATTSQHEGFCVPLVEAMAMRVPVVAYGSSAIPDTVGEAGLVWPETDAYLLAESIDLVVRDEALNIGLGVAGERRYEERFSNQQIEARFLFALSDLL